MKFTLATAAAVALGAQSVSAHYVYSIFGVNGQEGPDWAVIRQNSNNIQPTKQFLNPINEFACNSGSTSSAGRTGVARVNPGDEISFKLWNNGDILHPGPITVHMSKAPGDVRNYHGDGQWFKIFQSAICGPQNPLRDTDWCSWGQTHVRTRIPQNTPPGQYLVRVEHIAIHGAQSGDTEFYFTCAQVEVGGNGNGNPGPTASINGLYNSNDPALRFFIYGAQSYPYTQIGNLPVWSG